MPFSPPLPLLALASVLGTAALASALPPVHRYSFTSDASDSIGGAHGTVVDAGAITNAVFSGGQLDLSANTGQGSNGITEDAYVDLPNGIVSGAASAGTNGAISFEFWATVAQTRTWQRFGDFGTSDGGEDSSSGGGASSYVLITPNSGRFADGLEITNHPSSNAAEPNVGTAGAFPTGVESHVVAVFDHTDPSAGANGTMTLYLDGGLVGTNEIHADIDITTLNDNNNWLGRSQWNDPVFDGSYNEFRIYDHALDATEAAASFAAGPDQLPGAAPVIDSFTATPAATFEGDDTTLAWSISAISGSLDVSISPQPGAIAGDPASGNVVVAPLLTTTYTLTATDDGGSRTAEVTVVVDPGIPVADDQSVETNEGGAKPIVLTASDPNGGALTYAVVDQPTNGTLGGSAPNVTYTPAAGFVGSDSFTFRANDGTHDSNLATVSVTVNATPVPPDDITLTSNEIPSIAVPGSYIANIIASDANAQDTHAFALVAGTGDTHNSLFRISANQLLAESDFSVQVGNSFSLRLRATDNTGRSVEKAFSLLVVEASAAVVINEIHYDPPDGSLPGEFIELYNPNTSAVDLSQWSLEDGVSYTFPAGTSIDPGGYLVIAQDPATALSLYGVAALGPYQGRLSSDGEKVTLRDSAGVEIDEVSYKAEFPWPIAPGGDGGSMELLHHSLDNDLGSSWRASRPPGDLPEATLLPLASNTWSWRPGDTEASSPTSLWRQPDFVEDATWSPGTQTPIGYGNVTNLPLNTTVAGMQNEYTCLFLRNTFTVLPGEMPAQLLLRSTSDDGIVVWINGVEIDRHRFTGEPAIDQDAQNQGSEGSFDSATLDNPVAYLVEGENTIAVQLFNGTIGSSDLGFDLELIRPAATAQPPVPTPGERNSVFTNSVPPNIRQVNHSPREPGSSDQVIITSKVTDPQGVASVLLRYQLVAPGQFIPSRTPRTVSQIMADPEGDPPINPDFENPANWISTTMNDAGTDGDVLAGDGIYSATIPAQDHRTLVRYRIEIADVAGASARVPYPDDGSLNFAYFVYDGVPDYVASTRSVHPDGAGRVWPKETLTSLPVYHWLIRPQDMSTLQAYNGSEQFTNNGTDTELLARRSYDWEGALVYDGVVYDHIRARLRGGNSRYGDFDGRFPRGKRHYKFRFNRGNYFAAKDEKGRPYEQKWRIFNVSRMFGTKGGNSWGLPEEVGDTLYHTMGVPTQRAHWFHFRVIDGADEAPDQYNGDFWGIMQAQERYDVRFLESRDMTKGNLYKLSDFYFDAERQRRYQATGMVSDGSEFDNIRFNLHGGQTASWLNEYVNYEKWYGYSAVGEAIRHYDIFPEPSGRHRLKNLVWYFEPVGSDPARGVCWHLPYDYDASWGPNFNNGWDHGNNGLYGHVIVGGQPYIDKPQMKIEHRNVLRFVPRSGVAARPDRRAPRRSRRVYIRYDDGRPGSLAQRPGERRHSQRRPADLQGAGHERFRLQRRQLDRRQRY